MQNEAFTSQSAVVRYLSEKGFKISTATMSYHSQNGHLTKIDGKYPVELVDRFAAAYLKKASTGARSGSDKLISAKELKTRLEAERLQEQVHMARLQRERLEGKLISREEVFLEMASRAIVLSTGLMHMFQVKGPDIISVVEGNAARYPELIEFLQAEVDELLNSYASGDEFEVLFEESAAGIERTDADQG